MAKVGITPVLATAALLARVGPAAADPGHTVKSGESLWLIAETYKCPVDDLRAANQVPDDNTIYPGDRLALPESCSARPASPKTLSRSPDAGPSDADAGAAPVADPSLNAVATEEPPRRRTKIQSALVRYRVARGDTLIELARKYGTSVLAIQTQNELADHLIMVGQVIDIPAHSGPTLGQTAQILNAIRVVTGQSLGGTSGGRLINPTVLPDEPTYFRRRPHRAFGAAHTVDQVRRAARMVKLRHPKVHKLAVGDLSAKSGGKITQHVSHQSGRDVDLGFYFKRKPKGYPKSFITATAANLDFAATWTLLKSLADTADDDGGVQMMFLNYNVQKLIYDWARERGIARGVLKWMFQYPRGRGAHAGLIRHEPGHMGHVHVRFKCPPKDRGCR